MTRKGSKRPCEHGRFRKIPPPPTGEPREPPGEAGDLGDREISRIGGPPACRGSD